MALNGSLDDYSPAGALRVLSSTGKTGAVRFSGEAGCTVYLHRGQLYFARDEDTDHALASALVRPGRLSPEQWTSAIEAAGDEPRVGELLVDQGAIDGDLLASVLLSVVYDPLIRLFREGDGAFEFEADTVHWIGPHRTFNVDAIVNEVRRRVREVDEMSPFVPVDRGVGVGGAVAPRRRRAGHPAAGGLGADRRAARSADDRRAGHGDGPRSLLDRPGGVPPRPDRAGERARRSVERSALGPRGDDRRRPRGRGPLRRRLVGHASRSAVTVPDDRHGPQRSSGGLSTTAWSLPRRQPVALQDEPVRRPEWRSPWPPSEDVEADDPKTAGAIPGLEAIGGFRDAMTDHGPSAWSSEDPAAHPNAAWLESLYSQYMDEPEAPAKKRKKEMLDVAFSAEDQEAPVKLPTLRRLLDAIKKL